MFINRKEKENLVIELAYQGKTTREIANAVHISLKDIGKIIRKVTGDEDPNKEDKDEEKEKQMRLRSLSYYAQAFQMFKDGKSLVDVAIEIDQESNTVLNYYKDYLRLTRMKDLVTIYIELKDDFPHFFHLYKRVKKEGLNKKGISDLLENQQRVVDLEQRVGLYNEFIKGQQLEKQQLEREIDTLRRETIMMASLPYKK